MNSEKYFKDRLTLEKTFESKDHVEEWLAYAFSFIKNENYEVFKFYNGAGALECVEQEQIDLAILDVMLPDIDGFEILKEIRKDHNFPVIMLTAKTASMDKINGLTLGADDYIEKPFEPLELMPRISE